MGKSNLKSVKLFAMGLVAAFALCEAPSLMAQLPTIYGSMSENRSWGTWDRAEGIYSFQPVAGSTITPVYTDGYDLAATGGGVLVDDMYHLFAHREGSSSMFSVTYTSYNTEDWSVGYSCYFSNVIASNDMTYDPVTDKVYCAHKDGKLVLWDPSDIDNVSNIGTLSVTLVAIACSADGQLYGVGTDGGFYNVDKTNAAMVQIGNTGVKPKGYQSAVFDYASGRLYWAAYTTSSKSALYSIDIATGDADKIMDFSNNARFCGLYIKGGITTDSAPAAVEDFTVTFANGSNDGTATFTMPTKTFGGDDLTGQLTYTLEADDAVIATGEAAAGEQVSVNITVASGEHKFVLVVSNAAGESPRAKQIIYVGKGVPGYVDHAKAQLGDKANEVLVSWDAPDYCIPWEAYFDPSELRYEVVRQPGNVMVADRITECQVTDVVDYEGPLAVFSYEIKAYAGDVAGYSSVTNGVAIGDPLLPPYEAAMSSVNLDLFTIIDANHDGETWYKDFFGYGVACGGRYNGACDDWLILPPLHLEDKGLYHVIITVGNDYDGPSKWELKLGRSPKAESMTQTLMEPTSTVNSYEGDVRVNEAGTYYLGIHCIGAGGSTMYVTNVIVRDEAKNDAPDAPVNVSGIGAERGELAAYVTFTTPSMTIGGDRLDELTAVNIYHGEKLVYTLNEVEIDTEYTCKVEADQEFNEYSVAAVNEYGEGRRTRIEYVFAGYDYPATPTNVTLTEADNRQPKLTWDPASEEGLYGFYVNPDDVVYEIYRGYGNGNYDLIEEAFKGNEYVDASLDLSCDQFMLQYYVYPVNSIGRGYGASSNSECFGRPFATPFVENFPDGQSAMNPWYYKTNNPQSAGWSIVKNTDTTIEDYDLSNGMIAFSSENTGDEATLYAPYVTVSGLSNPVLDFYYYKDAMVVAPKVTANGNTVQNLATETTGSGWQHFFASLLDYAGTDRVRLLFTVTATNGATYSFVDNIRVRQAYKHDLAVQNFLVPEAMELGTESRIGIVVKNDGTDRSEAATLKLYRNGYQIEAVDISPLEAAEKASFEFAQVPDVSYGAQPVYKVVIDYASDQNADNNASAEITSSIKMPRYPAPENLSAESQPGLVTLTWTAPDTAPLAPDPIVEDFESYEAFAIEMDPWTLVDGDKHATNIMTDPVVWYENLDYPHCGEAMAYQIFDPQAAGIDCETYTFYAPHSGSKVAICWSTTDWSVPNDDWMISPELFAGGQTISFYVYSRTGYFDNEKYEVLYSATDTDIKSFKLLTKGVAVDEWTKVSVDLPADAKYFAIRTVSSQSSTEVWYDDITYIPATLEAIPLDFKGYNVYRDNVKINEQPVEPTTYVDNADVEPGNHKYNVTAVYGVGESVFSDDVVATVITGIVSVGAEGAVTVGTGRGFIRIAGANGRNMTISSVNGMTVATDKLSANDYRVYVVPGVYVVKVDGDTFKVIVR